MKRSWQTSSAGILAILTVLAGIAEKLTDGNAATHPDWNSAVAGIMVGIGLLFARDNSKSSEQVGCKRTSVPPKAPLAVLAVLCALTFSGCALANQSAKSRVQTIYGLAPAQVKVGTNVVTAMVTNSITVIDEKDVSGNVQALGDAKQAIQSMNAKNTKATQAIGIAGVEQESSLEGLKELVKAIFDAGKEAGKASATGGVVR